MVKVEDLVASRRESLAAGGKGGEAIKGIPPAASASVAGGGDQPPAGHCGYFASFFLGFAY